MKALDALSDLFRESNRVCRAGVLTFGDDEVGVHWRYYSAAAPRALHSQIVDDFAGASLALRRVLEETAGRSRAVRLRSHTPLLRFFHARPDFFRIVRFQPQCRSQQSGP